MESGPPKAPRSKRSKTGAGVVGANRHMVHGQDQIAQNVNKRTVTDRSMVPKDVGVAVVVLVLEIMNIPTIDVYTGVQLAHHIVDGEPQAKDQEIVAGPFAVCLELSTYARMSGNDGIAGPCPCMQAI